MRIVCAWMYAIGRYGFPPAMGDIFRALHEMKEMGFEYIELEGIGYENLEQVAHNRAKIKEVCEGEGLKVANFAVLLPDLISQDPPVRAKALEAFARGIEIASYLGSPYAWIDSYFAPLKVVKGIVPTEGLVYGQEFRVIVPDGFVWERFWDSFVDAMIKANEIAERCGVKLLLEPRVGEVASNTDAMLRVIELVGSANFGAILDVGHQHAQKELIPLCIEKLGEHLKYVHVADNDGRDNRHFVPGRGTVDWDEVFRGLKRKNFEGFFSIDLEKQDNLREAFLESKRFLEAHGLKYSL